MKNLPQHPGLFLQTKCSKGSKLYPAASLISLSLDALLDYNDKDIEESTFEKLRIKFVRERNQRKRQREEAPAKESDKETQKRSKFTDEPPVENESAKPEMQDASNPENENTMPKKEASAAGLDESNMEDNTDEEDPEEDDGEYQVTDDTVLLDPHEAGNDEEVADLQGKHDKETTDGINKMEEPTDEVKSEDKTAETNDKLVREKSNDQVAESEKSDAAAKESVVDKELLRVCN
ncbi:protein SHORT ROOT IN SALT MEDIUM 1-like [Magnolia sinica]|uniref:protein SHORT ROOT IN SALT MEDIUM 1-like n=1 Tax=Magnolia sinica TaxID=86752 RepID=UPI00265B2950|nr:protein SHORT ROOT IN SALT MEDIUM 1-like [Magnolia sinica]